MVVPATQLTSSPQQQPCCGAQHQLATTFQPAPFTEAEQVVWEQSEEWLHEELTDPRKANKQQKTLLADIQDMLTQPEHRGQLLQPWHVLKPYLASLCRRSQHTWPFCIRYKHLTEADIVGLMGFNKCHGGHAEDNMSTSSDESRSKRPPSCKRNRVGPAAASALPPDIEMCPAAASEADDTPAAAAKARQRRPPSNFWESQQTGSQEQ